MRKITIILCILTLVLFIAGCNISTCPECKECEEKTCPEVNSSDCPEQVECEICEECSESSTSKFDNKAILDIGVTDWAENIDVPGELFFEYVIYNYGDVEAKDVKVKCLLEDINENVIKRVIDNFGNLASKSVGIGDAISTTSGTNEYSDYYGYCYVESCSNCVILYEEIPDLVDSYND